MTLPEVKNMVRSCGISYPEVITTWKADFDKLYAEEKEWLCNLEDKLSRLREDTQEPVKRVIAKLKQEEIYFDDADTEDLSLFTSRINTIVSIVNRLNNFRQGTTLSDGMPLNLAQLFNHIKDTKQYEGFSFNLNSNLKAFAPHLFSVIKHCQDPVQYPIFYKYWRNIMREVYGRADTYDSMIEFYQSLPEEDRHLHFGCYLGVTGIKVAQAIGPQPFLTNDKDVATRYLTEEVLNLAKYQEYLVGLSKAPRHFLIGSKYGEYANESIFPELLVRSVIAVGFAGDLDLTSYYGEETQVIEEYLTEFGEEPRAKNALKRFLSLRPGDLVAVKADGSPKQDQGFLSIIGLAKVVVRNGQVYGFDPDTLGHTINVDFYKAPVYKEFNLGGYGRTLHELTKAEHINLIFNSDYPPMPEPITGPTQPGNTQEPVPLNQIIYGPPGTGKTYSTLVQALTILGEEVTSLERKQLKHLFDAKVKAGEIVFTTFHQNMSYEDFVEGIKPRTVNERVIYEIEDGIFKSLCNKARPTAGNFEAVIEAFKKEISETDSKEPITITAESTSFNVTYRGTGVFNVQPHNTTKVNPWYPVNIQNIRKAFETNSYEGVYNPTYVREIIQFLIKNRGLVRSSGDLLAPSPRVLIIDEINRGNVSQIFGELITLLEEDKREGRPETIEVVLPYSKEKFTVPANVYLIGTMNTADRSVEALDTALRRRFSFMELTPNPAVIATHGKLAATQGILEGISLPKVLQLINDRMEVLLNVDSKIGHAYFLKVHDRQSLKNAFYHNIIPLLQEYFFGDYGKIGLVLGDAFVQVRFDETTLVRFARFAYEDAESVSKTVYRIVDPEELDIIEAVKILLNEA